MRTTKTLIRLFGCADLSESSLGARQKERILTLRSLVLYVSVSTRTSELDNVLKHPSRLCNLGANYFLLE